MRFLKTTIASIVFTSSQLLFLPYVVFAAGERFDMKFMCAILTIAQFSALIPFVLGIGLLVCAFKEDGATKGPGLKCIALSIFLYCLLPAAKAGGFA